MCMRNKLYILFILALCLFTSCYNKPVSKERTIMEYTERQIDSLSFYGTLHYTNNYNFIVKADSLSLLSQQPEELLSDLVIDTFSVYRNDLIVVADFRIISEDAVDSVWVQVAKDQETFGWIHESELLENIVPDDPISQFIEIFSDIHLILFLTFAVFIGAVFVVVKIKHRNVKMPFFNDIDTFYPTMLCITVAFSSAFYATLQLMAPEMWKHFYFNPTLNPFSVPFPLNLFLVSAWLIVILGIATLDDIRRHLPIGEAILYSGVLAVFCALNYVVFSLLTLYYVGYVLLILYVCWALWHFLRHSFKPYLCGNCGCQLSKKGKCPHCGTMNY